MSQPHFDPAAYGQRIAADYDDTTGRLDPTAELSLLTELTPSGSVLELGIGTGRLALPLQDRGYRVAGVDGSAEMVELLRSKPGGDRLQVVVGDFSRTTVPGEFDLVLLVMNTIYALPSQQAQLDCFANAAASLRSGGRFVVDAWIPDTGAFRDGRALRTVQHEDGYVVLEVAELHPAEQRMNTNKIFLRNDSVKVYPANHRYAWPSELDLMARLAGLSLEHRWGDWSKAPYGDHSTSHVSVWCKD
jgi:SAM-dependent methyltransferase